MQAVVLILLRLAQVLHIYVIRIAIRKIQSINCFKPNYSNFIEEAIMATGESKKISMFSAMALIIGCVIGSGIFVMTGPLAAQVGPGLYLGYLIALVPAVGQGLTYAQLGSAMPTTSSNYTYMSKLIHPLAGFLSGWGNMMASFSIQALVSLGFASYLSAVLPNINHAFIAVAILTVYFILNIIGMKSSAFVNNIMVIIMIAVLVGFIMLGFPVMDVSLGKPLFPLGFNSLLAASAGLFFSYLGFQVAADIGEEVKNPGKSIPTAIIGGAAVVAALYVGVSYLLPRLIEWSALGDLDASLYQAASQFMPAWFAPLVLAGGLFAIMTSVNAGTIINSRNIYALSRDGWIPEILSTKSKTGAPTWSLVATLIGPVVFIFSDLGMIEFATMGSAVILISTAILAWAPITIMKRYPEKYANAKFKMPIPAVYTVAIITSVSSIILTLATVRIHGKVWLFIIGWFVPGIIIYLKNKNKVLNQTQHQSAVEQSQ